MMKPRHTKPDAHHADCIAAARRGGYVVQDTHNYGSWFLDFDAARDGIVIRVEVKRTGEPLTPREVKVIREWPGPCEVIYNAEDAIVILDRACRIMKARLSK